MISVDLSLEQLVDALRRLPATEKIALWRLLDSEIDRETFGRKFAEALQTIRAAHTSLSEDEVMADALLAVKEVRAARYGA